MSRAKQLIKDLDSMLDDLAWSEERAFGSREAFEVQQLLLEIRRHLVQNIEEHRQAKKLAKASALLASRMTTHWDNYEV